MGLSHNWNMYDGNTHADFVRGGVSESDFADEVSFPKPALKNKGCKRNKGLPHDFSQAQVSNIWQGRSGDFHWWENDVCSKCGKHGKGRRGSGKSHPEA